MKRMASAWFLLSLSVAQWVGGHLCFEVSYFMEVHRQMNAAEKALATAVEQETGIESTVRVLKKDEVTPRGNFYGDFVFSQETEKETIYYVVESQSDLKSYNVVANAPKQEDDATNSNNYINLLKGLFKEFMIPESGSFHAVAAKQPDSVFHFSAPCGFEFTSLFLHPPAQA